MKIVSYEGIMRVATIIVGEIQTNCFAVWDRSKHAIVIDPGAEATRILALLKKNRLSVAAYLLTHGHMDHISALADMYDAMPAPIGLHGTDLEWAFDESNQMPPFYPAPKRPPEIARVLEDGQEWTDGGLTYRAISTPGHTPGSVCFFFPEQNILFSGDTLFAGSVGRTDLPGGNPRILNASLAKIARLSDNTVVYPGHGSATNMAHEKKTNFFMISRK